MTAAELIVERWRRIRIMDDFLVITTLGFVWTLSIIVSMAIAIKWQEKHDKRKWKDINRAQIVDLEADINELQHKVGDCEHRQLQELIEIHRKINRIID